LHAPSNPAVKGSAEILEVMNELSKVSDDFEFIYSKDLNRETGSSYTVSRYELFQLYLEADIVIDQIIIGWYGLQSIEALSSNCKVICFIEDNLKQYLIDDCPIVDSTIFTLKSTLISLIGEIKAGNVDFKSQKEWVVKNHTIEEKNDILLNTIYR
jgi:hypothetical protein